MRSWFVDDLPTFPWKVYFDNRYEHLSVFWPNCTLAESAISDQNSDIAIWESAIIQFSEKNINLAITRHFQVFFSL